MFRVGGCCRPPKTVGERIGMVNVLGLGGKDLEVLRSSGEGVGSSYLMIRGRSRQATLITSSFNQSKYFSARIKASHEPWNLRSCFFMKVPDHVEMRTTLG